MDIYQFISALFVLVVQGQVSFTQDTCDTCDCKISSNEDKRAIFKVRTRCNSGSIDWSSAYGALRLEVQSPNAADFRLCFVLESHHTVTQVSVETPQTATLRNYRLSQKELGPMAMTPLVSVGEGEKSGEVCVRGRGREVLLFVEVERTNIMTGIPSLVFRYDVEPITDTLLLDPLEECRPCTQEELLESYCTSDFVAVGSMQEVTPDEATEVTRLRVSAAQLIHQNAPVFSRLQRHDPDLTATLHVPSKCGVKVGKGQFLFTGRMRLGKAKLRCAPYFKDWLAVSSMAECVYK